MSAAPQQANEIASLEQRVRDLERLVFGPKLRKLPITQNVSELFVIRAHVAEAYDYSVKEFTSCIRTERLAYARFVAMHLMRQLTKASFNAIGAVFGGRDHGSVMHGIEQVKFRMQHDAALRKQVEGFESALREMGVGKNSEVPA